MTTMRYIVRVEVPDVPADQNAVCARGERGMRSLRSAFIQTWNAETGTSMV